MTMHAERTAWLGAAQAQFRLLWWSRRAMMLLMIVVGTTVLWQVASGAASPFIARDLLGIMLLVGFGWGIAVWRGETAEQRAQMLTAPIDVSPHELARVAAGAAWLLLAIAGFIVAGVAAALLRGDPDAITAVAPSVWVVFFTAPLLAYALAVPISTGTPRALEYVVLGWVVLMAVLLIAFARGFVNEVEAVLQPILDSRYGLGGAFGSDGAGRTTGTWITALLLWHAMAGLVLYGVLRWRRGRI